MKSIGIIAFVLLMTFFACNKEDDNVISDFYMYPNPYTSQSSSDATFRVVLTRTLNGSPISITVSDFNGDVLWSYSTTITSNPVLMTWSGENNSGVSVAPGIYTVKVSIGGSITSERDVRIIIQ